MTALRVLSIVLGLGLGLAMAAGCQSSPERAPSPRQAPRYENEGYHRPRNPYFNPKPILAMDSAELDRLEREAVGMGRTPSAWYDTRNDARPSTVAGAYSPVMEFIATYSYDRQHQYGDQVQDHIRHTTYRRSYQQMSR